MFSNKKIISEKNESYLIYQSQKTKITAEKKEILKEVIAVYLGLRMKNFLTISLLTRESLRQIAEFLAGTSDNSHSSRSLSGIV